MTSTKKVNSNTVQIFGRTIGRNDVLARYWELANIDPASTKDGMNGQLSALGLLWEGLTSVDEATLAPNVFRAPWLPDPPKTCPS